MEKAAELIKRAEKELLQLKGHTFGVIDLARPDNLQMAKEYAKIISKLSPLVGNLIEFKVVNYLNESGKFAEGIWERQDPGFPDTIFRSALEPAPGFEIKAWFPLATEITARFKDSQSRFQKDNINVLIIAWLPESIIFGKPRIIDAVSVSALSIAKARDKHYHRPPDYLVVEPEDTAKRTANYQQTNTSGYKFQGNPRQLTDARVLARKMSNEYSPGKDYQDQVRNMMNKYPYRLDTNFAKIDRIEHPEIEKFKATILHKMIHGNTVKDWAELIANPEDNALTDAISKEFRIQ